MISEKDAIQKNPDEVRRQAALAFNERVMAIRKEFEDTVEQAISDPGSLRNFDWSDDEEIFFGDFETDGEAIKEAVRSLSDAFPTVPDRIYW
jgi:hypothetical protein